MTGWSVFFSFYLRTTRLITRFVNTFWYITEDCVSVVSLGIICLFSIVYYKVASWCCGRVSDLRSRGRRFESRRKKSGQVSHTYMNSSPSSMTWYWRRLTAGKVTAGLVGGGGSPPPGSRLCMLSPGGWLPWVRDQLRPSTLDYEYGYLLPFTTRFMINKVI